MNEEEGVVTWTVMAHCGGQIRLEMFVILITRDNEELNMIRKLK
jgi:hypothetical protein